VGSETMMQRERMQLGCETVVVIMTTTMVMVSLMLSLRTLTGEVPSRGAPSGAAAMTATVRPPRDGASGRRESGLVAFCSLLLQPIFRFS
jgi:hypothetical protein